MASSHISKFAQGIANMAPERLALVARQLHQRLHELESRDREPIAIIGISCRFPGAEDVRGYWDLLRQGVDAIEQVPSQRQWDKARYFDPDPAAPGKMYTWEGGFLNGVDQFDPHFFGISPREAARMDPQQRLLLESVWEALEDAGQPASRLEGTPTGVFVGISTNDFLQIGCRFSTAEHIEPYSGTGTAASIAAGRLSYVLGLQGPNFPVDTACSSALVALHLACQSLRRGESDVAVTSAVNLMLSPETTVYFCKVRALSPDGRCKTFDASANGYIRCEGLASVVLKRLSSAMAAGDRVLAVIRGTAVNHDGRTSGLTVPNRESQERLIRTALANAGVDPAAISYVEAHGTGTPLGDPIEVQALGNVFGHSHDSRRPLLIGSAKTNVGHAEAAAGLVGLIKVVLALQHKMIPPHLHFQQPNPYIPWARIPIEVNDSLRQWEPIDGRRVAGVSSFGFSGTNAHLIVAEPPIPPAAQRIAPGNNRAVSRANVSATPADTPPALPPLLCLSAKSADALRELSRRYARLLADDSVSWPDVCFSANAGRSAFNHRLAIQVPSVAEARDALAAFTDGKPHRSLQSAVLETVKPPKVAFLFTGQGSQYVGMARELYETQHVFRETIEQCQEVLQANFDIDLIALLYPDDVRPANAGGANAGAGESAATGSVAAADCRALDQTAFTQPALFAVEYALARLWRHWGVEPGAVMGHSVGEYTAACFAGVFNLEDGLKLIATRGRLMQSLPAGGRMVAVQAGADLTRAMIGSCSANVSIAAANAPSNTVISGHGEHVGLVQETLEQQGIKCTPLNVSHAFHSACMEPILDDFERVAAEVAFSAPQIGLVCNRSGEFAGSGDLTTARYWRDHIRQPVRFAQGMQTLVARGYCVFLEVGPDPVLLAMGRQCVPAEGQVWQSSLRRRAPATLQMVRALRELYLRGVTIDWLAFYRDQDVNWVELPNSPFFRKRFWPLDQDAESSASLRTADAPASPSLSTPWPGRKFESPAFSGTVYESHLSIAQPGLLAEHKVHALIVAPGASHLARALSAASDMLQPPLQLDNVTFPEALILAEDDDRTLQLVLTPDKSGNHSFRVMSRSMSDSSAKWLLHASGEVGANRKQSERVELHALEQMETPRISVSGRTDRLDLAGIQARCVYHMKEAQAFYRALQRSGVDLGPSFQWNQEFWRGDGEALSRMAATIRSAQLQPYLLHPGLIDSCVQSAAIGIPTQHDLNAYVPVSIGKFRYYGPAEEELWCHSVLRPDARASKGSYVFDVTVENASGSSVLSFEGLRLQRAPRTALMAFAQRRLREWLYGLHWKHQPRSKHDVTQLSGNWLVFADPLGRGAGLARRLEKSGAKCTMVRPGRNFRQDGPRRYIADPARAEHFDRIIRDALPDETTTWQGIVYMWAIPQEVPSLQTLTPRRFDAAQRVGCQGLLHLFQAVGRLHGSKPPKMWLVSRCAVLVSDQDEDLDILQAPLWGMSRVAALEFPHTSFVRIDLDAAAGKAADIQHLYDEIAGPGGEDQLAFRGGDRFVARLVPRTQGRMHHSTAVGPSGNQPYRLVPSPKAFIEDMSFELVGRIAPSVGEVEIAVRATGLNFRDVLNALGVYPGEAGPLGLEAAGTVTAVGPDVEEFVAGDRVVALAPGCLGPFALTDARLVARIPEGMPFAEAATIPIVFLTVEYALRGLAKLRTGETLLVHSAAGGVGLAALQIAQRQGATVIATAGSAEKRGYVRGLGVEHVFDSRNLDFAEKVMAVTDGRGVDVVLNALPGDYVAKNLAALAADGRFVEIGKSSLWDAERVAATRPDVKYHTFALDDFAIHQPTEAGDLLRRLMDDFDAETYRPLPLSTHPIDDVKEAFRFMAQSRHIGKVVVTQADSVEMTGDAQRIKANATYLITGGLGGIGLLLANWLAERGARHLVLLGRRPPREEALRVIGDLEASGVTVVVSKADMSVRKHVRQVLDVIAASLPPLAGIIHAAGVLDDGVLMQQQWSRFTDVIGPKARGALYLHELTKDMKLDWFVMFSSVASVWGSPGQANYAAANGFLDGLTHARRKAGLPATTINWGPWSEVGMAARMQEGGARHWWQAAGIGQIPPSQGITTLEMIMADNPSQVTVMPVDWNNVLSQVPPGMEPPLIRDLMQSHQKSLEPSPEWLEFVERLKQAPPAERVDLLVRRIQEEAGRVLGLDPESPVDPHLPLNELGFDSLMAVELANQLTATTGVTLPVTLLFDHPTIHAMSGYFVRVVLELETGQTDTPGQPVPRQQESVAEMTQDILQSVSRLTEDEVAEQLRRE